MDWISIIALGLALVCLVGAAWFSHQAKKQSEQGQKKIQSLEVLTKNLLQSHRLVERQLEELHEANVSFVQELERQSEQVEQVFLRTSQIQSQDQDSKLYTRAVKLVELGADLDEVMRECELPKAEAELLLSLRNKMKGQVS
ncbi:DUF2802 domain-containing protein [Agarivorans sp.]|uniref:DUF2802 domain-containing protein n=1 Tax=Agarivorans sp. TaxID=1872412 RepID=UPI003D07571A